ncbi:ABC transporter permease [Hamadaea tsunoensis]|uniref:ABC transporter permease n=1 Tax=Hamadaea tsunoensis TaxID=53368 RepID=UPI00047FA113|nr:ABC transporter permease [Hamadaea tsunoensis]
MATVELDRPRLAPPRMRPRDIVRVGAAGLSTRPTRALLSALGIAIGIAAMIAVVGISASSQADLDRKLAALGTNLLTVSPGQTMFGDTAVLPVESEAMVARIGPVQATSATGKVTGAKVYRSDKVPAAQTNGISVLTARVTLPATVGATVASGAWLNDATVNYPAVVLGAATAERLGLGKVDPQTRIQVGGHWFSVVGILDPVALAPELDSAALIGWPVAQSVFGFDGYPTTIYTRSLDSQVENVRGVLAATANPSAPNEVSVSRPSDALVAQRAAGTAFTGLLLGLGAVALLVGGVGVANTMVISVLERRAEIGLRRSLGATRGQIRLQFLAESLLLSALGGAGGLFLGILVTTGYAFYQDWPSVVPAWATVGGLAATILIGGMAGLYPAIRAARLSPTEALATP